LFAFRSESYIELPSDELYLLINSYTFMKIFDPFCAETNVLDQYPNLDIFQYKHAPVLLTQIAKIPPADFVLCKTHKIKEDGSVLGLLCSVVHKNCPPSKKNSRSIVPFIGYHLKPVSETRTALVHVNSFQIGPPFNLLKIGTNLTKKFVRKKCEGSLRIRKVVIEKRIEGKMDHWNNFLMLHTHQSLMSPHQSMPNQLSLSASANVNEEYVFSWVALLQEANIPLEAILEYAGMLGDKFGEEDLGNIDEAVLEQIGINEPQDRKEIVKKCQFYAQHLEAYLE